VSVKTLVEALQDDEEKALLVIGAAIALHGMLSGGNEPSDTTVKLAFDLVGKFQAEALRRVAR
jgi:hypothetical protein